jgi:hypothetical protein
MISIILVSSCRDKSVTFCRIDYVIPAHIDINIEDIKSRFTDFKTDPVSSYYAVIVLYSYSSGAETISFSGGDDVTTITAGGKLKALVKVMNGKKILKAEFVEGTGNSKEEMIGSFVKEIKLRLER